MGDASVVLQDIWKDKNDANHKNVSKELFISQLVHDTVWRLGEKKQQVNNTTETALKRGGGQDPLKKKKANQSANLRIQKKKSIAFSCKNHILSVATETYSRSLLDTDCPLFPLQFMLEMNIGRAEVMQGAVGLCPTVELRHTESGLTNWTQILCVQLKPVQFSSRPQCKKTPHIFSHCLKLKLKKPLRTFTDERVS